MSEMYHIIKFKLYEMINGPHFTKDLCEEALECIMEDYKAKEAEFEYEESKQVGKKFELSLRILMNMIGIMH